MAPFHNSIAAGFAMSNDSNPNCERSGDATGPSLVNYARRGYGRYRYTPKPKPRYANG